MMMLWMIAVVIQGRLKLLSVGQVAFLFSVAWLVFVLGYTGDGLFKPLSDYRFQSQSLRGDPQQDAEATQTTAGGNRFAESFVGRLPVPLPEQFILGVDVQKSNFESTTRSYLRGVLRRNGWWWWWYYYLYGVGVKSTVGGFVLFVLFVGVTIGRVCGQRRLSLRESSGCVQVSRRE